MLGAYIAMAETNTFLETVCVCVCVCVCVWFLQNCN